MLTGDTTVTPAGPEIDGFPAYDPATTAPASLAECLTAADRLAVLCRHVRGTYKRRPTPDGAVELLVRTEGGDVLAARAATTAACVDSLITRTGLVP